MEHLSVLEKKLVALIESKKNDVQQLSSCQAEIERLKNENLMLLEELESSRAAATADSEKSQEEIRNLRTHIEKLEDTLLVRHQNIEILNQERELTKMAVDDLIKDIDTIIGSEQ